MESPSSVSWPPGSPPYVSRSAERTARLSPTLSPVHVDQICESGWKGRKRATVLDPSQEASDIKTTWGLIGIDSLEQRDRQRTSSPRPRVPELHALASPNLDRFRFSAVEVKVKQDFGLDVQEALSAGTEIGRYASVDSPIRGTATAINIPGFSNSVANVEAHVVDVTSSCASATHGMASAIDSTAIASSSTRSTATMIKIPASGGLSTANGRVAAIDSPALGGPAINNRATVIRATAIENTAFDRPAVNDRVTVIDSHTDPCLSRNPDWEIVSKQAPDSTTKSCLSINPDHGSLAETVLERGPDFGSSATSGRASAAASPTTGSSATHCTLGASAPGSAHAVEAQAQGSARTVEAAAIGIAHTAEAAAQGSARKTDAAVGEDRIEFIPDLGGTLKIEQMRRDSGSELRGAARNDLERTNALNVVKETDRPTLPGIAENGNRTTNLKCIDTSAVEAVAQGSTPIAEAAALGSACTAQAAVQGSAHTLEVAVQDSIRTVEAASRVTTRAAEGAARCNASTVEDAAQGSTPGVEGASQGSARTAEAQGSTRAAAAQGSTPAAQGSARTVAI